MIKTQVLASKIDAYGRAFQKATVNNLRVLWEAWVELYGSRWRAVLALIALSAIFGFFIIALRS